MRNFLAGLLLILGVSPSTQAQVENFSQGRFRAALEFLDGSIQRVARSNRFFDRSAVDQADLLVKGGVRISAFNLQSLGRLYQNYPSAENLAFIKAIRQDGKILEDHLGEFDKYQKVGNRKKMEKAAAALMKMVAKSGWLDARGQVPLIARMKQRLFQLRWMPDAEDRRFVLSQVSAQIELLRKNRYDMGRLEAGLHELRRELRWFTIFVLNLDGLLIASPRMACPRKQPLFVRYGDQKYALPSTSKRPDACVISACLGAELVGAVGLFGNLKDEAEPIVEYDPELQRKDKTPPKIAAQAQKAYVALMQSGILDQTQQQMGACLR
jgi:hypothetical protein